MMGTVGRMLLIAVIVGVGGCGASVPEVADPLHPTDAAGRPMTGAEFVKQYCTGQEFNETCARVRQATDTSATKGAMPRGY